MGILTKGGRMSNKFKDVTFNFPENPEDSEFLKSWLELKEDPEFQELLEKIKREIAEEEQ